MDSFVYIVLNILLLFIFYQVGKRVKDCTSNYYHLSLPIIIMFVLVQGSRYNRGNDYMHYVEIYKYDLEENQILFTFINNVFKTIGIDGFSFYYIYALIFIVCAIIFLKQYRKYGRYVFPFFLISILMFHEYMIRQALGTSFIFLFLVALSKINFEDTKINVNLVRTNIMSIVICIVSGLMAYSIHYANLIFVVMAVIGFLFYRRAISPIISIPGVILGNYVLQYSFEYSLLSVPLQMLASANDKMAAYAGNADNWFSSSGFNSIYVRNPLVLVLEVWGCSSLFYFGKKALDNLDPSPLSYTLYNLFVVGYVFQGIFRQLELLNRMCFAISRFWFVPLAIVLYYRSYVVNKWYEKLLFVGMIFWFYEYAKFIIYRREPTLFLWDI